MNHLVYLAHTSADIRYEAIYSIYSLTLQQDLRNLNVVVYTDDKTIFEKYLGHLPIRYEILSPETIQAWKGPHGFIHGVKINTLRDALRKFTGNVLFIDSDTYYTRAITPIFDRIAAGEVFMHCFEKNVDNSRIYKSLLNLTVTFKGQPITFTSKTEVWNSGVIGLTNAGLPLADDAYELMNVILEHYTRHIIEQFAFSYVLRQAANVQPTADYVYHYWNLKEFRLYLRQIFEHPAATNPDHLQTIVRKINPEDVVNAKMNWKYNGGLVRAIERMFGKKFTLAPLNIEKMIA